jgi:hypothetical protein
MVYGNRGDHASAEQLLRQVLDIRRAALGEGHPDVAICLHNLAVLYCIQRKEYEAAGPLLRQASAGNDATKRHLQQLAAQPDDHRPFTSPFYWDAFTCQGGPSPLPVEGPVTDGAR